MNECQCKYKEDASLEGRRKEIAIKVKRVREMLDREGLNGLLLTKHSNFSWITAGGKSSVTLCVEPGVVSILVTRDGLYAITSVIEARRYREEEQMEELGFKVLEHEWYENKAPDIVAEIVGDLSKVGSDLPFGSAKVINEKINPLRYTLTDNEIGRYLYLGKTLSAALEEYIASVKPGMTEYEITGGLCEALWKHNIDQVLFLVSADERAYKYRHGIPTGKKLEKHLQISVNGRYKGLITTVTRMVHFGKKDPQLAKQYDDTCEIECRSIAAVKIGQDDINAYHANKKAYEDLGYGEMWRLHGQGGPQGYNNRDYVITPTSHGITQVNQCYCFNPVIDGTKTEDAFIVTEEGPLFVTRPVSFPKIYKEVDGIKFERPGLLFIDS
ncbi:MAG: M24 family metallopeptidase [Dethiobacteria bacterium]|jgi:Xaa-Pro aminopeptidase|nr:M24 family metallopeptidase [Bacillota bacterium]